MYLNFTVSMLELTAISVALTYAPLESDVEEARMAQDH